MDIDRLSIKPGPDVFYTKEFMDVLESHIEYFRNSPESRGVQVDIKRSAIYEGDFYGYLNELKIEPQYHWIIMRVNGMRASTEFSSTRTDLIVPDKTDIDRIRMAHKATGVISV